MYRCDMCNSVVAPGTTSHQVVSQVRPKRYAPRPRATPMPGKGRKKRSRRDDPGGLGWEAKSVELVCGTCLPAANERLENLLSTMEVPAEIVEVVDVEEASEASEAKE